MYLPVALGHSGLKYRIGRFPTANSKLTRRHYAVVVSTADDFDVLRPKICRLAFAAFTNTLILHHTIEGT